jgi:hypothetical protein
MANLIWSAINRIGTNQLKAIGAVRQPSSHSPTGQLSDSQGQHPGFRLQRRNDCLTAKPLLRGIIRGQWFVLGRCDSAWMLDVNLLTAIGTRGNTVVHLLPAFRTRGVVQRSGVLIGLVHRDDPFEVRSNLRGNIPNEIGTLLVCKSRKNESD